MQKVCGTREPLVLNSWHGQPNHGLRHTRLSDRHITRLGLLQGYLTGCLRPATRLNQNKQYNMLCTVENRSQREHIIVQQTRQWTAVRKIQLEGKW